MRTLWVLVLCGVTALGGAAVAGTCRTDAGAVCESTMPLGGYCECNVRGQNVDGTIVSNESARATAHSFQPGAPTAR